MTRAFIIQAVGVLCLASTLGAPAATSKDSAAATIQRKFQAFNEHDADKIQQIYAADAVLHSPDNPDLSGNEKIADTYRQLFALIPDAVDTVTQFDSVGSRVYAQFLLTGHLQGSPDKPVTLRLISVYTVRHGRIVLDNTYYDRKL